MVEPERTTAPHRGAKALPPESVDGSPPFGTVQRERRDFDIERIPIGINHAMIEDPAIFLSLGLAPFWLWVPRLVTAVVAVRLYDLFLRWRRARSRTADRTMP